MKKEVILLGILTLVFILPFATALNQTIITKAESCMLNKVSEQGCDSFGLEDLTFTLLSAKRCKTELLDNAINGECFGKLGCTVKETAQATLALSESGSNTDIYENWILIQNKTVPDLEWLLQVDSTLPSLCTIEDGSQSTYAVTIAEDKKLTISGSNCLTLDSSGYWLKINPACYDQEFSISCDETFLTSLLFKKAGSQIFYVANEAQSKSGGGTTFEKINYGSFCFKKGTACNYEGTAWAAITLKKIGYDVSDYLAYLIAFESDNEGLLPESFLYYLTENKNFKIELIEKQIGDRYWDELGNRYTDTALALLSLENTDESKVNAVNWLESIQGTDGCWDSGNIAETGFILYSLTGSSISGGDDTGESELENCTSAGYYCISDTDCLSENVLSSYECQGSFWDVCCSQNIISQTCEGNICDSYFNEECPSGNEDYGAVTNQGETCCLIECETSTIPQYDDTCTPEGGNCRDFCEENEESDYTYECSDYTQSCCFPKKGESKWWLWLLIILIILVIIAIIFKDKLKAFYLKLKSKKPRTKEAPINSSQGMPQRTMPPRRILPRTSMPPRRPISQQKGNELDDVLKKLKDMGK